MNKLNGCLTWLVFWVIAPILSVYFQVPNYNSNYYIPNLWVLDTFVICCSAIVGMLPLTIWAYFNNKNREPTPEELEKYKKLMESKGFTFTEKKVSEADKQ